MSIAGCVLTALLSFTAVTFNILTIFAVKRTVALSKNLKLLLINLAFSDTGVGLLVQPLYFALLMMEMDQMDRSSGYGYEHDPIYWHQYIGALYRPIFL